MQEVTLPGGETVTIPAEIGPEWFEHNKTGYLDPRFLAPYANQPRLYMDETKLEELATNVASQGVRESIVVTPVAMAPWATFGDGDEHLPFLIVSGHRRRQAALAGGIGAVPIVVRVYADKAAFEEDAETLNDHRQDLSEIEDGFRWRRKIENGEKITHLVERSGRAYQWIQGRVHLTYLCPTIQKKLLLNCSHVTDWQ